jgi:hypothetical protein
VRASGKRRLRILVVIAILALGAAGASGYFALNQLRPQPALYATGVLTQGPALDEALSRPLARAYLRGLRTQETWTSCGPASVVNLLASLGAPKVSEGALFDGKPWQRLRMRVMGMNLDALAELVADQDIGRATVLRDLSYEAFIKHLQRSNDLTTRYIVNFDRGPIFGVSVPHFSPIGGYDARNDRVALLDVTPGYGPSLIPSRLLYAAVQTKDSETGRSRGLLLVDRLADLPQDQLDRREPRVERTGLPTMER